MRKIMEHHRIWEISVWQDDFYEFIQILTFDKSNESNVCKQLTGNMEKNLMWRNGAIICSEGAWNMTKMIEELTAHITQNQNRYYRLAYSYVKEEQAALDVVQNAVVKALEHVGELRNRAYMGTWLYRIVINESVSYLRRSAREMPCEQEMLNGAVQEEHTGHGTQYDDPQMIVTQKPDALYTAILKLPETMQTVIKLYYFEELTMPEIAAVTGVNLSTVKYRLYEGLRKLKLTMKEGVA